MLWNSVGTVILISVSSTYAAHGVEYLLKLYVSVYSREVFCNISEWYHVAVTIFDCGGSKTVHCVQLQLTSAITMPRLNLLIAVLKPDLSQPRIHLTV